MTDWKEKLVSNVNKMVTSKKFTDYESVLSLFETQFNILTMSIRERDYSMAVIEKVEDGARFIIHDYDLMLSKKETEIWITKGNFEESNMIGKVTFDDEFSFIEVKGKTNYLCEDAIDKLFEEAYENLCKDQK